MEINWDIERVFAILAGWPRMLLISFTGQIMGFILYNVMFEKRRSMWKLICYTICKTVAVLAVDIFLKEIFPGQTWVQIFSYILGLAAAIFLCVMFNYTFYGGLVKCITGMAIGEAIVSLIWLPSVMIVNAIEKRDALFLFYGEWQMQDVLLPVIAAALSGVFYFAAAPFLRKYRTYQIKHKGLLGMLYFMYLLTMQGISLVSIVTDQGMRLSVFYPFLILDFSVVIAGLTIYWNYRKNVAEKNDFLKLQFGLIGTQYQSLQKQMESMERCQRVIDEQMQEIVKESDTIGNRRVDQYLESLKQEYCMMNAGIYCQSWLIDAVLYYQLEAAHELGIETECLVKEYQSTKIGEEELAQLIFLLLDFGIRENQKLEKGRKRKVSLQTDRVLGQLAIAFFSTTLVYSNAAEKQIGRYIREHNGIMTMEAADDGIRIGIFFYH